jgi:hypothetical protein
VHTISPLPRARASRKACLVLRSLLSLVLVLLLLVLETLVEPRVEYVGVAAVAPTGCQLLKGLKGLSCGGRVETNLCPCLLGLREESVDNIDVEVGSLGVEEAGLYEALSDLLLASEGLLALEASYVGKWRLGSLRDSLVFPNGRVLHIPSVRSFRCGIPLPWTRR